MSCSTSRRIKMCSRTKRAALLGLELPSQKSLPKEETILSGIDVLVARFYDCQNNLSWINSQESKHMLCTLTLSFRTLLGSSILRNFGRLVLGYIEADFLNQILITKRFSRSTISVISSRPNFQFFNFRTLRNFAEF